MNSQHKTSALIDRLSRDPVKEKRFWVYVAAWLITIATIFVIGFLYSKSGLPFTVSISFTLLAVAGFILLKQSRTVIKAGRVLPSLLILIGCAVSFESIYYSMKFSTSIFTSTLASKTGTNLNLRCALEILVIALVPNLILFLGALRQLPIASGIFFLQIAFTASAPGALVLNLLCENHTSLHQSLSHWLPVVIIALPASLISVAAVRFYRRRQIHQLKVNLDGGVSRQ